MKKWLWLVLFLWTGALAHSAVDEYGNTYVTPAVWRSSAVASAAPSLVTITTQAVEFGGVIITSAGVGSPAVGIYDNNNALILSTISATIPYPYPYGEGIAYSSGLKYINTGSTPAVITIFYQYKYKRDAGK